MRIVGGGAPEGRRVLDLFAGTGALGLEALSRGAARAVFVDDHGPSRALIRKNVETLGLNGVAKIWRRDATRLGPCRGDPYDLLFLDPVAAPDASAAADLAEAAEGSADPVGRLRVPSEQGEAFLEALRTTFPDLTAEDNGSPFASSLPRTFGAGIFLNFVWSSAASAAPTAIALALRSGVSVYDPQDGLCYVPPHLARTNDATIVSPWLQCDAPAGRTLLGDFIPALPGRANNRYAIVERRDGSFAQTMAESDGTFVLEYKLTAAGTHWCCTRPVDASTVVAVLSSFVRGRHEWPDLPWSPLERA